MYTKNIIYKGVWGRGYKQTINLRFKQTFSLTNLTKMKERCCFFFKVVFKFDIRKHCNCMNECISNGDTMCPLKHISPINLDIQTRLTT